MIPLATRSNCSRQVVVDRVHQKRASTISQVTQKDDPMPTTDSFFAEGGCTCRSVRYRMTTKPLFVHCCHCRWCQRETGASFALNAMIEADRVELVQGEAEAVATPTLSGKGQKIFRCPSCRIALWSNYA